MTGKVVLFVWKQHGSVLSGAVGEDDELIWTKLQAATALSFTVLIWGHAVSWVGVVVVVLVVVVGVVVSLLGLLKKSSHMCQSNWANTLCLSARTFVGQWINGSQLAGHRQVDSASERANRASIRLQDIWWQSEDNTKYSESHIGCNCLYCHLYRMWCLFFQNVSLQPLSPHVCELALPHLRGSGTALHDWPCLVSPGCLVVSCSGGAEFARGHLIIQITHHCPEASGRGVCIRGR